MGNIEEQRRKEEALDAIMLAGLVSKDLRQTDSMTMQGSTISRTKTIDPRRLAQQLLPGSTQPQQRRVNPQPQPSSGGEAMRFEPPKFITPPKGMELNTEDFIPPELRKTSAPLQINEPIVQPQQVVSSPSPDGQLELAFGPTTIKDIHERIDSLNSKIDEVLSILKKQYERSITLDSATNSDPTPDYRTVGNEPDKKKSGTKV